MTKLANSFLLLHDFFAIMHVNSETKVLPNAASKGGRRLHYLSVIVVFFNSFHRYWLVHHLHIFTLEITSIPFFFFFNRTEILNFESNTEPSRSIEQYRYFGELLHPYMPGLLSCSVQRTVLKNMKVMSNAQAWVEVKKNCVRQATWFWHQNTKSCQKLIYLISKYPISHWSQNYMYFIMTS